MNILVSEALNEEEAKAAFDAVYAEELGLQLFPYLDNYYCEVRAHLKTEKSS